MAKATGNNLNNSELGQRIRRYRQISGMSHETLESISGVSNHTISDIENGKVTPKIETIYKLCKALNIGAQNTLTMLLLTLVQQVDTDE